MNTLSYISDRRMLNQNIKALALMARQRIDDGWHASLMTFTFAHIPGNPVAVLGRMGDAADRVYRTLLTNTARRPASPSSVGVLPILIGAPDQPVPKRTKPKGRAVALNGGRHMHAMILVPRRSRLPTSIEEHFRLNLRLYARPPIEGIDVRPITRTPEQAMEYVLKSVRRGRFSFDDVLILPRAFSELRA